ncbi:MAG: TnsD family Tn7-like transposition protein [Sulfuritalea sp.]|nr:TnsD family Tn7-like transposition protein [Sulfuritalea sp.]MDP1982131.1 TnsD family Tn7-like transposition protein [Sulfuritalea sp.]
MDSIGSPIEAAAELFDTAPDYLPRPFDGEPLYGWCARFHRLSGSTNPTATSRQLFGHPTAGLRHDFTSHLDHFHLITSGLLGSISELIHQRTQFALYAPFLDQQLRVEAMDGMRGNGCKSLLQRMGLTRGGLGPMSPLKACQACIEEDQIAVPSGRWHMDHQWDSTRVCLRHGQPLLIASDYLHAGGLKNWYLPKDLRGDQWQSSSVAGPMQLTRLTKLAQWTQALLEQSDFRYEGTLLRYVYLLQAKTHGWISMDGALRLSALRESFANAHQGLDSLSGMEFLKGVTGVNGGFLGLLLREYPGSRHPVKHIFLMGHLFAEPDEFFARYKEVKLIADSEGVEALGKTLTDIRTQLREMVGIEGKSVNAVCKELGIPPTQGIRQLRKEGISYKRRPRVLTPDSKQKLDGLLKAGAERNQIATSLGIRSAFIKDYLAEHPEIRTAWKAAYEVKRTANYRDHFLEVLQNNPGVPIKRIRRIPGNGFEWLYRNDRDWLAGHLPEIWRR